MLDGDDAPLVTEEAVSYVCRLGPRAVDHLHEMADIADGNGDPEAAGIWREIAAEAGAMLAE